MNAASMKQRKADGTLGVAHSALWSDDMLSAVDAGDLDKARDLASQWWQRFQQK